MKTEHDLNFKRSLKLYKSLSVCVRIWPLLREFCKNYVVVMFEPCTVTPTNLGFFAIVATLNLALLPHLFLRFLNHSFPSYILLPPNQHLFIIISLFRCCICSPPLLLAQSASNLDVTCTRHPPASAACICDQRHRTTSAVVFCDCTLPPLPTLACA